MMELLSSQTMEFSMEFLMEFSTEFSMMLSLNEVGFLLELSLMLSLVFQLLPEMAFLVKQKWEWLLVSVLTMVSYLKVSC